jgi:hypothetical protein
MFRGHFCVIHMPAGAHGRAAAATARFSLSSLSNASSSRAPQQQVVDFEQMGEPPAPPSLGSPLWLIYRERHASWTLDVL